ncbi:MAG: dihydrofolate reductase family protein, partial [Chloroflexota bacterium]
MAKLVYGINLSVDGYVADAEGRFDWSVPTDELHAVFNDLIGATSTHLYGRRMYELMAEFWPAADELPDAPDYVAEYARIWRAMPKVVFSASLHQVEWNSRLVAGDAVEEVTRLKT